MKVGIMAIGDELISGMTQDTNSSYIAREIVAEGWELSGMLIVGDDEEAIEKGLEYLMNQFRLQHRLEQIPFHCLPLRGKIHRQAVHRQRSF